ncbi:MAG TPA: ribosome small subunit-dependent GTPase A, partial [Stenomitos sp.]
VGDRVTVAEPDWQGQRGAIAEVWPRHNQLERPPVANVDQALLVCSLTDPPLNVHQISRFLVALESAGLKVLPCLSKADLLPVEDQQAWCDRLRDWGYQPTVISVYAGTGLSALQAQLQNCTTVLAGPSGVGKSSFLQVMAPSVEVRVGSISERWRRGKHTTRHVELFELPSGGFLADTPGFNQPTLTCRPEQLIECFPEGRMRLADHHCQFKDCLHRDEPNCVVRGSWERYDHYLTFLEEAITYQTQLQQSKNPEAKTKRKYTASGTVSDEPLLDFKRHRRTARRTQLQSLEQLYEETEE